MNAPQRLIIPGGSGEGLSSNSSSVSGSSTYSLLNLLPSGADLRRAFRDLNSRLKHQSQELSPQDRSKWQRNREQLARLIWNHTARPSQIRQDTSYEARDIGGRKVIVIGCQTKAVRDEVRDIIEDSGALYFVRSKLGFDEIRVDMNFKGHLAKTNPESVGISGSSNYEKSPILGMSMDVTTGGETGYTSTTLGGVILVDGKPYALASGCPFSKKHSEPSLIAELVVYSYSDSKNSWDLDKEERVRGRNQCTNTRNAKDWALVALPDDIIPPNSIVSLDRLEDWPWHEPSTSLDSFPLLVDKAIDEIDLGRCMRREGGKAACLIFPKSSPVPLPGMIASGTSTIILDGMMLIVLRIDMLTPLEYGDSGSWVLVGNAVCGIIIAGTSRPDEPLPKDRPYGQQSVFSAYMIPMKEILESISETLNVEASLPNIVDHRIDFLRRQASKWDPATNTLSRALDMELLLCQQKQRRRSRKFETLKVDNRVRDTTVPASLSLKMSWPTRYVLEDSIGLRYETIHYLLSLGHICPLSAVFRPGLRQWARDYRKSRWHNRRTFVCAAIIKQCLQTEAGENLLGLLILMWKSQRQPKKGTKKNRVDPKRRIAWLAQLLSSLFSATSISTAATPSTQQLQSFVYCIISAFKDKDLKHLYLVLDENSQIEKAVPSSDVWSMAPPPRLNAIQRAWHSTKAWVSGRPHEIDLIDADTASLTFYAEVVLGLDVSCRIASSQGARRMLSTFPRQENKIGSQRPDVVVYFTDGAMFDDMCEIVDRIDVGQELSSADILQHATDVVPAPEPVLISV
ncbi:hypothetical protein FBEOM_4409 [Fusarium beomiforme]|uniref:Uncharacterized protein n=1 Tax=Fusarium beomiforme TaxID=44412 RepID=A0A9P5AN74_9HYPO|nr:hypothetical protein FBEOM_4409 [Fusarium beomiforme]